MLKIRKKYIKEILAAYEDQARWYLPKDLIHAVMMASEQAVSAQLAADKVQHYGADSKALRKELAKTASLCIRALEALDAGIVSKK